MLAQRTLVIGGQLTLLALIALFAATSVNGFVGMALRPQPQIDLSVPEAVRHSTRRSPITSYAAITQRDIFNPPRSSEPQTVAVTNLKAKLLGTAPGEGIDSFAIIVGKDKKTQELYRVGDSIQNRTLVRVEWDRVYLKNGPREEVLVMEDLAKRAPTKVSSNSLQEGIQARGEHEFTIARSEINNAIKNMNQLFTQVRAVPHFQDGEAKGFRLFAIQPKSIFQKIGLRNGDVISSVNGKALTDPARAMALLQELRDKDEINVDITRNRQPTTLAYEIR